MSNSENHRVNRRCLYVLPFCLLLFEPLLYLLFLTVEMYVQRWKCLPTIVCYESKCNGVCQIEQIVDRKTDDTQ